MPSLPRRSFDVTSGSHADPRRNRADLPQILRAAASLFRQKGYAGTSIQDIADEVGILKGSLYHHIDSKEDLLVEILDDSITALLASVESIRDQPLQPREKLRALVESQLRAISERQDQVIVFIIERERLPQVLADIEAKTRKYNELFRAIIQEGIDAGVWSPSDPRLATLTIVGIGTWFAMWYQPNARLTLESIIEMFTSYSEAILRAEEIAATPARSNAAAPVSQAGESAPPALGFESAKQEGYDS